MNNAVSINNCFSISLRYNFLFVLICIILLILDQMMQMIPPRAPASASSGPPPEPRMRPLPRMTRRGGVSSSDASPSRA